MVGPRHNALCFALASVLATSSALAGVPTPSRENSNVPCGINLVGMTSGAADARGTFSIVIRDLANNPFAGSSIVIDFNNCSSDIQVCSVQPRTGTTADCSGPVGSISAVTDGTGTVTMCIVGGARNAASHAPGAGYQCATVYADGVNMGGINVAAFDQNGAGGVNPADISVWLSDAFDFPGVYVGRSDFNCSHSINPTDLAMLLQASLDGASFTSCSGYCH
jgi:hypothetical protein